jgi:hypothetical protein
VQEETVSRPGETALAYRYLYTFRRIIASVALVGAGLAWAAQLHGLFAACVCVGIGELIACTYYLGVLRWEQRRDALPPLTRDLGRFPYAGTPAGFGTSKV